MDPRKLTSRIGWLRSVANIYHAFAVQCFTDETGTCGGRDPLDYLLDLIGKPRTIDFKGVEYPNYGASMDAYPWETGRSAVMLPSWSPKNPGGESAITARALCGDCGRTAVFYRMWPR